MSQNNHSSSNSSKNPYMRLQFWFDPDNQFWETGMYSEKTKEQFRERFRKEFERERALTKVQI